MDGTRWLALASCVWGLLSISAAASEIRIVALRGQSAPSAPDGIVFEHFGSHPGIGGSLFAPPNIDNVGRVSFHAFVGEGDPNTIEPNALGIWKEDATGLVAVARSGDPAPDTAAGITFVGFPSGLSTVFPTGSDGGVVIAGGLRGPGVDEVFGTNNEGFWTDRSGMLRRILREGDAVPGMGAVWRSARSLRPAIDEQGTIRAFMNIELTHSQEVVPAVFVGDTADTLALFVIAGASAPDTEPGVVFGESGLFTDVDALAVMATDPRVGGLALIGNLAGPGVNEFNNQGIWIQEGAELRRLVREGDPVPGFPGARFGNNNGILPFTETFSLLMRDGAVVFSSRMANGDLGPFMRGIWTNRGGALELIVKGTLPLQDSAPGDRPPGMAENFTFAGFLGGEFNRQHRVVFRGLASEDLNPLDLTEGIWWDVPGQLELVIHEGLPVPDADPGVAFVGRSDFLRLTDGGRLFFSHMIQGPGIGPGNNFGYFLAEPSGTIRQLLRTGQEIDVGGDGSDVRVLATFGVGFGVSDADEVVLELFFTDGSTALAVLAAPTDGLLGDVNCDGQVSVGDINPFVLLLTDPVAYASQFPDCEPENGDCSGDGAVTVGDINCFVALIADG